MALQLTNRKANGVTVVEASGRLTLGPATGELRDHVKQLLADGASGIVLNLSQVDYVDSSGLGTLVGLHSSATAKGARIKLASLSRLLRELMVVTKLLTVFDVYDNEADAIASFTKPAGA